MMMERMSILVSLVLNTFILKCFGETQAESCNRQLDKRHSERPAEGSTEWERKGKGFFGISPEPRKELGKEARIPLTQEGHRGISTPNLGTSPPRVGQLSFCFLFLGGYWVLNSGP
jgi:hypothetical protein